MVGMIVYIEVNKIINKDIPIIKWIENSLKMMKRRKCLLVIKLYFYHYWVDYNPSGTGFGDNNNGGYYGG